MPVPDPARIGPVLDALRDVWQQHPHLRLGQLLVDVVCPQEPTAEQVFNIGDGELLRRLRFLDECYRRLVAGPTHRRDGPGSG